MQTVSIHDQLTFTLEQSDQFSLDISAIEFAENKADVPVDQNNLIAKAARLFYENLTKKTNSVDFCCKVSVHLKKSVPVAGGMGGGSGNAAATLVVLNKWFNEVFSDEQLKQIASQLGADVPFFIDGGTQIGTQRGDVLSQVASGPELWFLIVGPKLFGMSTPEVYRAYDEDKSKSGSRQLQSISASKCAAALMNGELESIAQTFGNAFEPCVYGRKPELRFISERLKSIGGLCTHLTGSGPTIYVLASSEAEAIAVQQRLNAEQQQAKNGWSEWTDLKLSSWVAKSTNVGVTISELLGSKNDDNL